MADYEKDTNVKRFSRYVRRAIWFVVCIIVLLLAAIRSYGLIGDAYDFGYGLFAEPAMSEPPGREMVFYVEEGETSSEVISNLVQAGLIKDGFSFRFKLLFYDKAIQPGEYLFNTSMSGKEILGYLDDGPGSEKKGKE